MSPDGKPVRVAIGIGSNVGDRRGHLDAAVAALGQIGEVVAVSSYYETAPIGGPEQGDYLNAVAVVDTVIAADELLERLFVAERDRGRLRRERWGPRTLDLDILLYGDQVIERPGLAVPHPRMTERRFVLEPLLEVWPEASLPDGTPLSALLSAVSDQDLRRSD